MELDKLIEIIEASLERQDFWLPINSVSREHFFDPSWTDFYGLFENSCLIAASALFYNEHEFGESLSKLHMPPSVVAEIGRSMVHPMYRGNNLLYKINSQLLKIARTKGIEYILATIHPENIPSQKSFKTLGLQKKHTYTKSNGYVRDIFLVQL